jgi:protein Mpv17
VRTINRIQEKMAWRATVRRDTAIAGILGLSADIFTQTVCEKKALSSIDKQRSFAIALFSGFYLGVACNYIYSLYPTLASSVIRSNLFQRMLPACETRSQGVISTVADNFVHVPVLYLPSYFVAVGTLQGLPIDQSIQEMQDSWWHTLGSCWAFWVPFMVVNFSLVNPTQRVKAVAGANFCWTVCLDYITQHKS